MSAMPSAAHARNVGHDARPNRVAARSAASLRGYSIGMVWQQSDYRSVRVRRWGWFGERGPRHL